MAELRDYNIRTAGIPWVRKENYASFLAICEDSDGLPTVWEEFIKFSQEAEDMHKAQGFLVIRAYIDPDTFPGWCKANGYRVNSKGRIAFAASIAAENSKSH